MINNVSGAVVTPLVSDVIAILDSPILGPSYVTAQVMTMTSQVNFDVQILFLCMNQVLNIKKQHDSFRTWYLAPSKCYIEVSSYTYSVKTNNKRREYRVSLIPCQNFIKTSGT